MKTWADSASERIQDLDAKATIAFRVELLEQWGGAVVAVDSGTQIKVAGDATGLFEDDDSIVLLTTNFSGSEQITSAPSYAAGPDETTIVCSGAAFTAELLGLNIARLHFISLDDIEEISPVTYQTEADAFGSALAGEIILSFNNDAGAYSSASGDGIFDAGRIVFIRVYAGWRGSNDRLLVFGGVADRTQLQVSPTLLNVGVAFYCHLRELERYPAWQIADPGAALLLARGFTIQGAGVNSAIPDALHRLTYNFPGRDPLSRLEVVELSQDTPPGYRVLRYRPPDNFSYDYGSWSAVTAGTDDVTLTGAAGHTLKFNAPSSYPLDGLGIFLFVDFDGSRPVVAERGKATLRLGSGPTRELIHAFEGVIHHDGATYSDITFDTVNNYGTSAVLFDSAGDSVYIFDREKFPGILFTLASTLVASVTVEYSQGFGAWAALTHTDETAELSQGGRMFWDLPQDWTATDFDFGGSIGEISDIFIVRLTLSSYTSGSASASNLSRTLRATDEDGFYIDMHANMREVGRESFELDIIGQTATSGAVSAGTWPASLPLEEVMARLFDTAGYGSADRAVDAGSVSLAASGVAVFGQMPYTGYRKKVSAIAVDDSTTPDTIYLGVGDEVWKGTEESSFSLVGKLTGWDEYELEIIRLVVDGNGYLQGVAVKRYDRIIHDTGEAGRRAPAVVFRSTNGTSITEENRLETAGNDPMLFDGRATLYPMDQAADTSYIAGKSGVFNYGENVSIPFPQYFRAVGGDVRTYKNQGLLSTAANANNLEDAAIRQTGWYFCSAGSDFLAVRVNHGTLGCLEWFEGNDEWVGIRWTTGDIDVVTFDHTGTVTQHNSIVLLGETTQFTCSCVEDDATVWAGALQFNYTLNSQAHGQLFKITANGIVTLLWDFAGLNTVEANQSLSGAQTGACITDLCYNATEDTLHGCVFDRATLGYHWFVYDILLGRMYSRQALVSGDFDEGMQLKGFCEGTDGKTYAVACDPRYGEKEAYLLSADFDDTRTSGQEIEITALETIAGGEYDLRARLTPFGSKLLGATGSAGSVLFQYGDSFYPWVPVADFGRATLREALEDVALVQGRVLQSRPERKIRLTKRDTSDGTKALSSEKQITHIFPLREWAHYYDRVEITWRSATASGVAAVGIGGWQRRVLSIRSSLVQSRALAQILAQQIFDFVNSYREVITLTATAQLELEVLDAITLEIDAQVAAGDFSGSWVIQSHEIDHESGESTIIGLQ